MMANLSIMFEVDKYILIGQLITYDALRDLVPFLQFKKRKKKQKKKTKPATLLKVTRAKRQICFSYFT